MACGAAPAAAGIPRIGEGRGGRPEAAPATKKPSADAMTTPCQGRRVSAVPPWLAAGCAPYKKAFPTCPLWPRVVRLTAPLLGTARHADLARATRSGRCSGVNSGRLPRRNLSAGGFPLSSSGNATPRPLRQRIARHHSANVGDFPPFWQRPGIGAVRLLRLPGGVPCSSDAASRSPLASVLCSSAAASRSTPASVLCSSAAASRSTLASVLCSSAAASRSAPAAGAPRPTTDETRHSCSPDPACCVRAARRSPARSPDPACCAGLSLPRKESDAPRRAGQPPQHGAVNGNKMPTCMFPFLSGPWASGFSRAIQRDPRPVASPMPQSRDNPHPSPATIHI